MISHDSDDEFDNLIQTSISQADETIKYLRHQYELSLQKQNQLQKQVEDLQCHRCQITSQSSKQIQCSEPFYNLRDAYCQTEKYSPDSDERFFLKVDDIVDQNKKLHSDIFNLQQQLEQMNATRKAMRSDFSLKFSEAIERMKILENKREKSYHGRIQMLEEERTMSLCSLGTASSVDSGSFSESKPPLSNILYLADIDKDDIILKNGDEVLRKINHAVQALTHQNAKSVPSNELNKIRFEKDTALKKCVKLDSQLSSVKKSKESFQAQVNKLEEELQSLRLFYNLHQSLSQEASLRDQYDTQVFDLTERLKQRETELLASQHENDALAAMVKRLERQLSQVNPMVNGYISQRQHYNNSPAGKSSRRHISSSSTLSSQM